MIELKNFEKFYKNELLIKSSSIIISDNSFVFILGKNGIGKTSLFKCILNLETFNGDLLFDSQNFNNIIGQIFAIFDDTPLYSHLTGFQNIQIFCPNITTKIFTHSLLESLNLNQKVKFYSYGQKKKLSIFIAILLQPKYLIIDELTNGLDYETISWLKTNLKKSFLNCTILATGHQFDFYNDLVEELLIISNKQIKKINLFKSKKKLEALYEEFICWIKARIIISMVL